MSMNLNVEAVRTRIFHAGEDLAEFILQETREVPKEEGLILAVTSKIMSLAENRLVPADGIEKPELVRREADEYLGEIGYGVHLTVKHGLFIASAGIDESNSESGGFILYPENPDLSAENLWQRLREAWGLRNFGVIVTDSHTTPLRRGVTGISLAHWGFHAVRDLVGSTDLFGRRIQVTTVNCADALAAAAVLLMGEGAERRPLAFIRGADVEFTERTRPGEVRIPLDEDIYSPVLRPRLRG